MSETKVEWNRDTCGFRTTDSAQSTTRVVDWGEIENRASSIFAEAPLPIVGVFGVPISGIFAAMALCTMDDRFIVTEIPEEADIIVDDVIDSGETRDAWVEKYGKPFFALVEHHGTVEFPWDRMKKVTL